MFLYVCKHTFHIIKVRISEKLKVVVMRNLSGAIFYMKTDILQNFHICISVSLSKTPSNSYVLFLFKVLDKHLWNTLLYLVVEILQLVHEIRSFPDVLYKRGDLKNFSRSTDKHNKQSPWGVLSKDVLKNFAKFTGKHLCWSLLFNKVAGWEPETVRSSN